MLPRHPEGADLRVKSFLFRLQAALRCRCEPSLEGDAWGNGMQAVIARTAFGRRAGALQKLALIGYKLICFRENNGNFN